MPSAMQQQQLNACVIDSPSCLLSLALLTYMHLDYEVMEGHGNMEL